MTTPGRRTRKRKTEEPKHDVEKAQIGALNEKRVKSALNGGIHSSQIVPQVESLRELRCCDLVSEIPKDFQHYLGGFYVATEGKKYFNWHCMNPVQVEASFPFHKCSNSVEICMTASTTKLTAPRYEHKHRHYVVDMWDLATNTLIKTFGKLHRGSKIRLNSVATSLAVTEGKTLCLWDIESESKMWSIDFQFTSMRTEDIRGELLFFDNDQRLVTPIGGMGSTLVVDAAEGKELAKFGEDVGAGGMVFTPIIAVDSSGKYLARCLGGGLLIAIHCMAISPLSESLMLEREVDSIMPNAHVHSIAFVSHERLVLISASDACIWNFHTDAVLARFPTELGARGRSRVCFHAASNVVMGFAPFSRTLFVFDADSGAPIGEGQINFTSLIQGVYCQQQQTILL